ncbi:sulfate adenylyltransferase [Mariprofundus erugo]|uniref:Sulfate adenylyltransferase n=1 Tax=Mariprofundus erugo TaxID=2528639 RepID=A0A5R9GYE6_9PROT|nr:sulfate adenylyltransferase [Mariprofundus erugo]
MNNKVIYSILTLCIVFVVSTSTAGKGGFSPEYLKNIELRYGKAAMQRIADWQELIDDDRGSREWSIINDVNEFFNRIPYISDAQHWHREDYWATPVELLATNGGDCEDYSIAKYFTLLELGIPDERLRITYVKALRFNQAHMVLAYYEEPESDPLILDNLVDRIKPASSRTDLLPIYSFNGSNLWMSKERGQGRMTAMEGGSQRINLWRDLNVRMDQERQRGSSFTAKNMTN